MKKTIFSTFLFILFILFLGIFYLSFFGFETDKFNKIIKSKINESNNNVTLDFEKISILLDIKKLTLFVKFLNQILIMTNSYSIKVIKNKCRFRVFDSKK